MKIIEIVREHLRREGFDGLCYPDIDCGCVLDDFAPCGEPSLEYCRAGYAHANGGVFSERESTGEKKA
jgi:hypothetical protein